MFCNNVAYILIMSLYSFAFENLKRHHDDGIIKVLTSQNPLGL